MKILVLSNLYPPHEIGGYEIRCRDVCERLVTAGHTIHVLTSNHQIAGRGIPSETHVSRKLRLHGMYGHSWLPIHKLRAVEAHNHRVLRKEINARRPDVIHIWNMGGVSKSLLLHLETCGIPVVYDVSDHWIARSLRADVWLSWWNRPGLARRALTASGLRGIIDRKSPTASCETLRFQQIYFCSAFMRDFTVSKGWPVGHASIIHCGVDTRSFTVKKEHDRFERLLWVGRLSEDKDPFTAVRALAAAGDEWKLGIYGHGEPDYLANLQEEIKRLGLANRVSIQSATAAEMRDLYARHDALLFTSNWGEPFALTPLEAMASGLPVITSLDGGQRELARHQENCLVAAAADPELYAARIRELASSRELRERLSSTALAEARERFDISAVTRQIEDFLKQSIRS